MFNLVFAFSFFYSFCGCYFVPSICDWDVGLTNLDMWSLKDNLAELNFTLYLLKNTASYANMNEKQLSEQ